MDSQRITAIASSITAIACSVIAFVTVGVGINYGYKEIKDYIKKKEIDQVLIYEQAHAKCFSQWPGKGYRICMKKYGFKVKEY